MRRDGAADEAGLRKPRDVEPVGPAQVLLELGQVEIDAGDLDQHRQSCRLGLLGVEVQGRIETVEAADQLREAEMVDLEQERRVLRIDPVAARGQLGRRRRLGARHEIAAGAKRQRQGETGQQARPRPARA
jgi:hypothetical protein